jgi:hypothetical protein
MEKHCESEKRFGKEGNGWHRDEILTKAREFLEVGGSQARREIVRTTLELDRLLGNN